MHAEPSKYQLRSTCPTCIRDATVRDLSPKSIFIRAKKLENTYAKRLRSIARIIDHILRGFDVNDPFGINQAEDALKRYATTLTPWASAVAGRMIAEVAQRDERSWFKIAALMGRELRKEIAEAPTGQVMRNRLDDQVKLITSLPLEAAQRVHHLAREARVTGTRADTLAKQILETGEVTKARANLIARTETSRTATELTKARAEFVGSEGYIWRTVGDTDVRKSHKHLNGKYFRWDAPPESDPGYYAHPGCIFNCRCYCEVVLPGD